MDTKLSTCSTCQYWRSLQIVDASAIADPKTVPVKDIQMWCSNSKSPNFRYKSETFERFVMAENTCEEWTERGRKAPILQRIQSKGLAGLKLTRKRIKIPCILWIIALLALCGCSMEMTVIYLFWRGLL